MHVPRHGQGTHTTAACVDGRRRTDAVDAYSERAYRGLRHKRHVNRYADTGRCTRMDWSRPTAIQTAMMEVPP